jgi:hypothetical protein
MDEAERLLLESLGMAFNILTLFDVADFYTARPNPSLAEERWEQFEARKGEVFNYYFPGIIPMSWLSRAVAAQRRLDGQTARKYSQKILSTMSAASPHLRFIQVASNIARANSL